MPSRVAPAPSALSSRAKRGICFLLLFLLTTTLVIQARAARPKILGIEQVLLYSTDLGAAHRFYTGIISSSGSRDGSEKRLPSPRWEDLGIPNPERVVVLLAPELTPSNLLTEVVFSTSDLGGMKRFLTANKIVFSEKPNGRITLDDPEGHRIAFDEYSGPLSKSASDSSKVRIIHAGFIVHNRAATEHFYKDILGFRPYWHGGMKDDQTDWVSLQVPDGTDWLEFMVNVDANADQRLRGIMNHIAIGVTDIHETEKRLRAAGAPVNEEPKIGRDGKWQLNLYDPDLTRIEFMEFTPVQKPCCSDFTGPHPQP